MKRFLISITLILESLGVNAQAFSVDSSFIPSFDIRSRNNVNINNVIEFDNSAVTILGAFSYNSSNNVHNGILATFRNGTINNNFKVNNGISYSDILLPISLNRYYFGIGNTNGKLIDTLGSDVNIMWQTNFFKTVSCFSGIPYFYPNGSSIFPNGFSQTANGPCPIINLPDTFPGRHLIKVKPDGLWDSTFAAFPNREPNGVIRYDSTRLLVYGAPNFFSHYNGVKVNGLCRIFEDGSLDTTFQSPLSDTMAQSSAVPILTNSSGSFFLKGRFYVNDGVIKQTTLIKLHKNGSIDNTFSNYQGAFFDTVPGLEVIYTMVETSDNGFLVGGSFTSYQGHKKNNIVKLDSNGIVQPQYFTGLGPDSNYVSGQIPNLNYANVLKILKSKFGGYYVAGDFLKWNGQPSQPIVRIHGLNTTVGLNETLSGSTIAQHDKVLVYPNPTTGIFRIESELAFRNVEVFDLIGGLVHSERSSSVFSGTSIHSEESEYSASEKKYRDALFFNLTNFDAGIYFLKIELENGELVMKKVVRQ